MPVLVSTVESAKADGYTHSAPKVQASESRRPPDAFPPLARAPLRPSKAIMDIWGPSRFENTANSEVNA